MANKVDTITNRVVSVQTDGFGNNFNELTFPSEHQYVIIDTQTEKADQKFIPRLPLTFKIVYGNQAVDPPALTLLINPQQMTFNSDKKVNAEFTRGGYVVEEWGEMQDTLEFSGKIGGYYVLEPDVDFSGLNRYHRSKSPSFKNLMNLLMIFRNNGAIYEKTIKNPSAKSSDRLIKNRGYSRVNNRIPRIVENAKNRISSMGDVFLLYDGVEYRGAFDEFSIEESSENPYTLSYKFTFIVASKRENDYRDSDFYFQHGLETRDLGLSKFSGAQKRKFQRALDRFVETSKQSVSQEQAALAKAGVAYTNPNSITDPRRLTVNNIVESETTDRVADLRSRGLNVDDVDRDRIRRDTSRLASDNFTESRRAENDSFGTHYSILRKNGRDAIDSQTSRDALNLASEHKRSLNEKLKIAKIR